jgi:hypothetical protein
MINRDEHKVTRVRIGGGLTAATINRLQASLLWVSDRTLDRAAVHPLSVVKSDGRLGKLTLHIMGAAVRTRASA